MKFFNVEIDEDLHAEFKVLVAKKRSTMVIVLAEAIKDILEKYKDKSSRKIVNEL